MSGTVRLTLAAISVADLARSRRFYQQGCGFTPDGEFSTPRFDAVILRAGETGVELLKWKDRSHDVLEPGNMFSKFVIEAADPAGFFAAAGRHGGSVVAALTDYPGHGRAIGVLADPDGYRWEVVGPLSSG